MGLDRLASELNQAELDKQSQNQNDQEGAVVADVLEHVQLVVDLPRVYPVEQLHEHKRLEDQSVVQQLLSLRVNFRSCQLIAQITKQVSALNVFPLLDLFFCPV